MAAYFPQTVRMLEMVRSRAPETVTVAGGYGGLYISDPPEGEYTDLALRIEELTDHICREEGVRCGWMKVCLRQTDPAPGADATRWIQMGD